LTLGDTARIQLGTTWGTRTLYIQGGPTISAQYDTVNGWTTNVGGYTAPATTGSFTVTSGAVLDTYGVKNGTNIATTGNIAQTVTANTWYDTGISRSDGDNHSLYCLMGDLNLYASGLGTMYSGQFASVLINWNSSSTNSTSACALAYGPIVAHAPNSWTEGYDRDEQLQFRIKHEGSNGQDGWRIQYLFTTSGTLANVGGKTMNLWLRRVG
jgi:hypothetical protein